MEPLPGPPGYHADFSLPFGKPEAAQFWTVRVPNGYGFDTYGPFEVESEAVRWAFSIDCPRPWIVEPLRRPEDWPGKALMEPEEPDMPLLDGLEM